NIIFTKLSLTSQNTSPQAIHFLQMYPLAIALQQIHQVPLSQGHTLLLFLLRTVIFLSQVIQKVPVACLLLTPLYPSLASVLKYFRSNYDVSTFLIESLSSRL